MTIILKALQNIVALKPNELVHNPFRAQHIAEEALAAQPELPEHVSGVVLDEDGSASLIRRGTEVDRVARRGGSLLYTASQLQQAVKQAQAKQEPMKQSCSDLDTGALVGLTVSVDVSTGDADSGNRLFGTVYEVQEDASSKSGITLLVADVEANFEQPHTNQEPLPKIKAMQVGVQAINLITSLGVHTTDAAYALTRFYEQFHGIKE